MLVCCGMYSSGGANINFGFGLGPLVLVFELAPEFRISKAKGQKPKTDLESNHRIRTAFNMQRIHKANVSRLCRHDH